MGYDALIFEEIITETSFDLNFYLVVIVYIPFDLVQICNHYSYYKYLKRIETGIHMIALTKKVCI